MKKQILMLAAVCAATCCLAACNKPGGQPSGSNEYDTLNAMLTKDYSQIVLNVTNTFDENTWLTSEYTMKYFGDGVIVEYAVEEFTNVDSSLDNPSTELKTTLKGEAQIVDGEVVSVSGADISFPASIVQIGLDFQKEYFKNSVLSGVMFQASVTDVSAFFGSQIICTDMKVSATFSEFFDYIRITYKSESNYNVEYKYIFTI